jgi:hypothetical protein
MKRLTLIALLLCGCVGRGVPKPSAFTVQMTLDSATGAALKAAQNTAAAERSLRLAAMQSKALLAVATPMQRPLVIQLQTALDTTQTELESARVELNSAHASLADSSGQLGALQQQIREIGSALSKAQEENDRTKAARDFWRACSWKLALLSLALGVWAFRKPLLALASL